MHQIGFMQGRLVDQIDGKIQAFPWADWRLEFPRAAELDLALVEWTLDQDRLRDNPFINPLGQQEIRQLSSETGVRVNSLTGDCFMQAPFWKVDGDRREALLRDFDLIIDSASTLGVRYVVVPLVDAGRLESAAQKALILKELLARHSRLIERQVQIIFETDYNPSDYAAFMSVLPPDAFNVNYDTGNSASLGFDPREELSAYGERVVNVHIKDRVLGGTTVPLGTGAAQFDVVFAELARLDYQGAFVLQTARAKDGDHRGALARYLDMTRHWIRTYYGS